MPQIPTVLHQSLSMFACLAELLWQPLLYLSTARLRASHLIWYYYFWVKGSGCLCGHWQLLISLSMLRGQVACLIDNNSPPVGTNVHRYC